MFLRDNIATKESSRTSNSSSSYESFKLEYQRNSKAKVGRVKHRLKKEDIRTYS
jgi:hypothetical protein